MPSLDNKLTRLQAKKEKILQDIQNLSLRKSATLYHIFRKIPMHSLDLEILLGGLLHVIQESEKDAKIRERWKQNGHQFRRRFPLPHLAST
jgi:hypothetical protein